MPLTFDESKKLRAQLTGQLEAALATVDALGPDAAPEAFLIAQALDYVRASLSQAKSDAPPVRRLPPDRRRR